MESRKQVQDKKNTTANIVSMLSAGLVSNTFTHPLSVASHNAVKHKRKFLLPVNFSKPFAGYLPTLIYGPVLHGQYFFLQDGLQTYLQPRLVEKMDMSEQKASFVVNQVAGLLYGMTSTPLIAVQRQIWNDPKTTFFYTAKGMYKHAGLYPFYKGMAASALGGALFSGSYQVIRSAINNMVVDDVENASFYQTMPGNTIAAMTASVLVSPFYYARFRQQVIDPKEKAQSMWSIAKETWKDIPPRGNLLSRVGFLCRSLDFCPAAMRAGMGIMLGQFIYDKVRDAVGDNEYDSPSPSRHT